jgi:hypothetical protein
MGSALLDLVEGIASRVAENKLGEGEGAELLKRIVHGPALAFLVKATPTPVDDLVLDLLQAVIPPPASASGNPA